MRLVIGGGPRTGKTTLARNQGLIVKHTDDVMHMGWSEASDEVSHWFDVASYAWCIEGVAVARALRKWLARNPKGTPCDKIIWCRTTFVPTTPQQDAMAKGCEKVFEEICYRLEKRGVEVIYR